MKTTISTEGRVFVAQLIRDLRKRERTGASLLAPGTSRWLDAFEQFGRALHKTDSPTRAGKLFATARERLVTAQKQRACFLNCFQNRKRSGYFQCITWEVAKHPLTGSGYEGIIVQSYDCHLAQRGHLVIVGEPSKLAFLSWHALARMYERGGDDIFSDSNGIVAGCGITGLLMRESAKHANTGINLAMASGNYPMLCTGVLRYAADEKYSLYGFFDVVTVLPPNETQILMWKQGLEIATLARNYIHGEDATPIGADKIAVLPFRNDDYVSRTLAAAS